MTGQVDDKLRALLQVPVAATLDGPRQALTVWVDTAFNGVLTIPRSVVLGLGLSQVALVDATLADGSKVALETFECYFEWFGRTYQTQIVASDAAFPLLGTQLLDGHRLVVDYASKLVELI